MLLSKQEIEKLIDDKLTAEEKQYYKRYLAYMVDNGFIDIVWFLKHKHLFFRYMK
jgi:predicted transport protein